MAIFSANTKIVQRSKGNCAVHSSAYYRGTEMYDERTGTTSNYSWKKEVVHSEIVAISDAPEWVQQILKGQEFAKSNDEKHSLAELFWNTVEKSENRKDSQVAYRHFVALPNELSLEQNIALAKEIAQMHSLDKTVVEYNIHLEEGNVHMHMLETMRHLTVEGFGLKNLDLCKGINFKTGVVQKDSRIYKTREQTATIMNKHLEMAGQKSRVSHLSNEERGILLAPSHHRGGSDHMEQRGIATRKKVENEQTKRENYNKTNREPWVVLAKMAQEYTEFDKSDIAKEVIKQTPVNELMDKNNPEAKPLSEKEISQIINKFLNENAVFSERQLAKALNLSSVATEQFVQSLEAIKGSEQVMRLGVGYDGRERFTTKEFFRRETLMQDRVDIMARKMTHFIGKDPADRMISHFETTQTKALGVDFKLNTEQKAAVHHMLSGSDVFTLTGFAGSGKTTALTPAVSAWKSFGYTTFGLAASNVAANNLRECGFDKTYSIAAFLTRVEKSSTPVVHSKTMILIDEASMVCSEDMAKLTEIAHKAGAKLGFAGDEFQFASVMGGAPYRAVKERIGGAVLSEIVRQQVPWQRKASLNFATGNTKDGLLAYHEKGHIHFTDTDEQSKAKLIKAWSKDMSAVKQKVIIAHTNEDVADLNSRARKVLSDSKYLGEDHSLSLKVMRNTAPVNIKMNIAKNDRITFLTDKSIKLGDVKIARNQFATIKDIKLDPNNKIKNISFELDGLDTKINITPQELRDNKLEITHSYAATAHKFQGSTRDKVYIFISSMWDSFISYVGSTRHRKDIQYYTSHEQFKDFDNLTLKCGRKPVKDSVLDFAFNFAQRRGYPVENLTGIKRVLAEKFIKGTKAVKEFIHQKIDPEKFEALKNNEIRLESQVLQQQQAHQNRAEKNQNAVLVKDYLEAYQQSGAMWSKLAVDAQEQGFWDNEKDRPKFHEMQHTKVYKEASFLTEKSNLLAEQIYINIEQYKEILQDLGVSEEIIKQKDLQAKFARAVMQYKQDPTNNFDKAHFIYNTLDQDPKFYPKIIEADIDIKALTRDSREYQRQQYHLTLKGKELEQFKIVEHYNEQTELLRDLKNNYNILLARSVTTKEVCKLDLNQTKPINIKIQQQASIDGVFAKDFNVKLTATNSNIGINSARHNAKLESNIMTQYVRLSQSKEVLLAKEKWLNQLAECEKQAYTINSTIKKPKSVGLQFYQFDNQEILKELHGKYEAEKNKEHSNQKVLDGLETQMNYLTNRQEQIPRHSLNHQCLLNIQKYQNNPQPKLGSTIRGSLDQNYNRIYHLARSHNVDFNQLLSQGEKFDSKKIYNELSSAERKRFDRVAKYLECTRASYKDNDFEYNKNLSYNKAKLAHEITSSLKGHTKALEFYHIATEKNDEIPGFKIKNFDYLIKNSDKYNSVAELINNYNSAKAIEEKRIEAVKLRDLPSGAKEHIILDHLKGTPAKQFAEYSKYNSLIIDTKKAYKEYIVLNTIYEKQKLNDLLKDQFGNPQTLDDVLGKHGGALALNATLSYEDRIKQVFAKSNQHKYELQEPRPNNHVFGLMQHFGLKAPQTKITKEQLENAKNTWTEVEGQRNEIAYNISKNLDKGNHEVLPSILFKLDNKETIEQLRTDLEPNKNQIKTLTIREQYISNHANIHQCHLNVQKYKQNASAKNASIIRETFKEDLYGINYKLASSRKINWNKLLTKAEDFDRKKIWGELSNDEKNLLIKSLHI
jgi:hypothetical protein